MKREGKKSKYLISILTILMTMSLFSITVSAETKASTWSPDDKTSNVTLTNQNLTATLVTKPSGPNYLRASEGKDFGKWYWEINVDSATAGSFVVGVSTSTNNVTGKEFSTIYSYDGSLKYAASSTAKYGSINAGTTLGFAIDVDNKTLSIYKNGSILVSKIDISHIPTEIYPFAAGASSMSGQSCTLTANFGSSAFKYSVPDGFLPYNSVPTPATTTLEVTSIDKAKVGDEIAANVVIHNATNICAEDINLTFDTTKLDFISAENADGMKIYKEDSTTSGSIRFITASLGKQNAANGDKVLLKLKFRAKAVGEAKIDIVKGRIADNSTLEVDVNQANCGEKTVLIEANKDVNRSGEFTLLDLGIDAWYYGDSVTATDTTKYDTDVVENQMIDDADLTEIVKLILQNKNYPNS